jgi:hypothetical protein
MSDITSAYLQILERPYNHEIATTCAHDHDLLLIVYILSGASVYPDQTDINPGR